MLSATAMQLDRAQCPFATSPSNSVIYDVVVTDLVTRVTRYFPAAWRRAMQRQRGQTVRLARGYD